MKDTTGQETRLQALANLIAAELDAAPPRPKLKLVRKNDLVKKGELHLDPQTRDIIYSRIRDLARVYGLGLLIRQETAHCSSRIECLEDKELTALLQLMERARESIADGISIDEAGLVRRANIDY